MGLCRFPSPAGRSPGWTAASRPDRADSTPARSHPVDPPAPQPGEQSSERAAAELQPLVLTPDAATVRPPGEGEVVRSSPKDLPLGLRRQEAALEARLRLECNAIGGGSARFSWDLAPPAGQASPINAQRGLEKKKGCTAQPLGDHKPYCR